MTPLKKILLCITAVLALLMAATAVLRSSSPEENPPEEPAETAQVTQPVEPSPDPPAEVTAEEESSPGPEAEEVRRLESCEELLTYRDTHTGGQMNYWCYIPEGATEDYPIIVFLHGDGYVNRPEPLGHNGVIQHAKEIYGGEYPFILLAPNTVVASWEEGTIPDTLLGLIESFRQEQGLTTEKIILTGHSRGAIGTWYIASIHPELFSCAVPVSCPNDCRLDIESLAKVPIRAFVGGGAKDFGRYGRDMQQLVDWVLEAGGDAELTVLEGCEHAEMEYMPYTKELFEWMLLQ